MALVHRAALCLSVIFAGASYAQQGQSNLLARLRTGQAYQQGVLAGAIKTAAWSNQQCGLLKTATVRGPLLVQPPDFDAEGRPVKGEWIEQIDVAGCADIRQLNVAVVAQPDRTLTTIPMLPGTTHADRALQKDGAFYAFIAATPDPNGCKPVYVANTRYVEPLAAPPLIAGKPGWREVWTVAQCDRRTDATLDFMPDATGTVITSRRQNSSPTP